MRADASPLFRPVSPSVAAAPASNCTPFCVDASGHPSLFNDRELSFLRFQTRVFEEAQNEGTPLLERVKFLAIVGTHLDDFVMVRIPELRRNAARRMVVESVLRRLTRDVRAYWRRQIVPALRAEGVHIEHYQRLGPAERNQVDQHFSEVVRPHVSLFPCGADSPFPHVPNLGMNLLVRAANGLRDERLFVLRIPDGTSALVPFHRDDETRLHGLVWLDQVVIGNLSALFPEFEHVEAHRFRLLREMDVPESTLTGIGPVERVLDMLAHRERNPVVTVTVDRGMPLQLRTMLARGLGVPDRLVDRCSVVADLRRLWEVNRINRPDLKAPPILPHRPASLRGHTDIFEAVRDGDVLFHHPYESFQPIVDMIEQAAHDPDVVSMSVTLYRTDRESPIAHALVDAARRGRRVRVLIELNARLDERRNANWWRVFEQAGAKVFAAPTTGLKVHTKMALIVRDEGGQLRRYAHLSSGNYNAFSARVYTDLGLLTCDHDITTDVEALFDALCSGGSAGRFRALTVAPLTMRQTLNALVEREIACQRGGQSGHIVLKMNGLVDRDVIQLLYRASQEGVKLDLLVRGVCCLRPGMPGVSDRIRVRSIVGRFLEHSRVWYFRNGGDEEVYVGSADLIPRNLDHRIEVMAPLKDAGLRRRVLGILQLYLADNVKAHELCADGRYVRVGEAAGETALDAQLELAREPTVPGPYDAVGEGSRVGALPRQCRVMAHHDDASHTAPAVAET